MKKTIEVHKSGTIYIVMSIALGLLAINGGNNFHYLAASAVLGYMLASGIAGRRNIRNAEVSLSLPDEIYAGSPFLMNINVRNKGRTPIFLIDVKAIRAHAFFSVIQPGETMSRPVLLTLPSRGVAEVRDIELSSAYPFDFFTRYWPVEFRGEAIVFPRPLPAVSSDARVWTGADGTDDDARRDDFDREMIGVRPYNEGDPMRIIHWKSTARTGRLNSRLYEGADDPGARIIDVDSLVSRGVEPGLSRASYEIARAIKSGAFIGMSCRGAVWPPSSSRIDKLAMMSYLAVYE
ncbi:MAG: DUF58 domain-containing protein [Synergistaceae bacterium]|jgi:uncharacterized protein (DUF58 family)|nr:DUF58 domain-containing protein [Synergistaceae bacterium]